MEYAEVTKRLSTCGLDCSRCAEYDQGEIKELSEKMLELLSGYARVAGMKADQQPVFKHYKQFEDILKALSLATCAGCREINNSCPVKCTAKRCHKEKGVDFCFECSEYPCENPIFAPLKERWRNNNDRMKKIGVTEFYCEQAKLPRY
jgi:hypothetical protein